jgi:hypothetical protein
MRAAACVDQSSCPIRILGRAPHDPTGTMARRRRLRTTPRPGASAAVPNTARHTPNQLGDPSSFRVDLLNNSTSPLQITSYSGSDWDTADGIPAVERCVRADLLG